MTKKLISTLLLFLLVLTFSSCGAQYKRRDYFAMDTVITLNLDAKTPDEVFGRCEKLTKELEEIFSATKEESEVSAFNQSECGAEVSGEVAEVIKTALDVASSSEGKYDPTVRPLVEKWDISHGEEKVPGTDDIEALLACVGYKNVTVNGGYVSKTDKNIKLDLGGIAKGYACERAVRLLEESGVNYGTVSFGGNVGLVGKKPDGSKWKLSVTDPYDPGAVMGYMSLDGGFVAVSGDYERYFEKDGVRYHHILDPQTGYPVNNGVHSVAVWCEDGTLADALSTALFALGEEKSIELYKSEKYKFEALIVSDSGITMTNGMKSIFTETDNG